MKNRRIKHPRTLGLSSDKVFRAASPRIIIPVGLTFILFVLSVFLIFIPFIEAQRMALVSSVILVLALLFALYIILESVKSERKRMEAGEKLHESEKMFRTLCEEAPFGISITGSDLRFEYLNPKFISLFGYTQRDIPDKETWFMKAYPEKGYREKVRSTWQNDQRDENKSLMAENGIARVFTVRCKNGDEKIIRFGVVPLKEGKQFLTYQDITEESRKDGRLLDVSISASRFQTYEGKASGLFVILRDISEKKALEAQFYEAQKMESVGTLAGGIAHDFNNLLMAIQGNVSIILLNQSLDDGEYERIKNIERYVQKGSDITKQLLGFARGGEI